MNKQQVIDEVIRYLEEELRDAVVGSADEQELKNLLLMYRFLPVRNLGEADVVCPAALVQLEYQGIRAYYFVAPKGGGLVTRVDGSPVQVVTPQSPIGEAILGKKSGESVSLAVRDSVRSYKIITVS